MQWRNITKASALKSIEYSPNQVATKEAHDGKAEGNIQIRRQVNGNTKRRENQHLRSYRDAVSNSHVQ